MSRLAASKITKNQKQLPLDKHSIIVITADQSLLFYFHNPLQIILSLREAMSSYSHVFGVVVTSRCGAGRSGSNVLRSNEDLFISSVQHGVIDKQQIVVVNKFCKTLPSEETVARITEAFERKVKELVE